MFPLLAFSVGMLLLVRHKRRCGCQFWDNPIHCCSLWNISGRRSSSSMVCRFEKDMAVPGIQSVVSTPRRLLEFRINALQAVKTLRPHAPGQVIVCQSSTWQPRAVEFCVLLELWLSQSPPPHQLLERNHQSLVVVGLESGSRYLHYGPAVALDLLGPMLDRH